MGRVLIVHFRVGRMDGVSLEIGSWKELLIREGWEVLLAGGDESVGADYVISHLENQLDEMVYELDEEAFSKPKPDFEKRFLKHQSDLREQFDRVIKKTRPDRVVVSNIFSVGENLAAAGALADVLQKYKKRIVAVLHDFYWENCRYRKPGCDLVAKQLDYYYPPLGRGYRYATINSIAQKELASKKGIKATVLHDTLDFSTSNISKNVDCRKLLENKGVNVDSDLVVLQATRIVRRKNIEIAMDVVRCLQQKVDRQVVLVLAGYAEKRDEKYQEQLREYAGQLEIKMVELNGLSSSFGPEKDNQVCTFMDIYPFADVVTYPSEYEGFGNQFLEAVYAKKPIVVFEYPVFKADIKPLKFEVVSLGDNLIDADGWKKVPENTIDRATNKLVEWLGNKSKLDLLTKKNFQIGKDNFSYEVAGTLWKQLLD